MVAGALFNVASSLLVLSIPPVMVQNVSGNGLRMEWAVRKDRTAAPDQATITIYNLMPELRMGLQVTPKIPGPVRLALAIGFDGIPDVVFSGEIWKLEAERRQHNGDILSVIEAGDGAQSAAATPPGGGTLLAVGIQLAIAKILGQLGWTPTPAAMAEISAKAAACPVQSIQITGERDLQSQLSELLASIGLSWGLSGGRFVVYSNGVRLDMSNAVILNPMSGLLEWSPVDDDGVRFHALAQARLEPGHPITIQDPYQKFASGVLRVDEVSFDGASDGSSTMTGIARPLGGL